MEADLGRRRAVVAALGEREAERPAVAGSASAPGRTGGRPRRRRPRRARRPRTSRRAGTTAAAAGRPGWRRRPRWPAASGAMPRQSSRCSERSRGGGEYVNDREAAPRSADRRRAARREPDARRPRAAGRAWRSGSGRGRSRRRASGEQDRRAPRRRRPRPARRARARAPRTAPATSDQHGDHAEDVQPVCPNAPVAKCLPTSTMREPQRRVRDPVATRRVGLGGDQRQRARAPHTTSGASSRAGAAAEHHDRLRRRSGRSRSSATSSAPAAAKPHATRRSRTKNSVISVVTQHEQRVGRASCEYQTSSGEVATSRRRAARRGGFSARAERPRRRAPSRRRRRPTASAAPTSPSPNTCDHSQASAK